MATKKRAKTDLLVNRYVVRVDAATASWLEKEAKATGHYSPADFIREIVKRERAGKNTAFEGLEASISATLLAQSAEIERMQGTSYAAFAAVMGLAQMFLQTVLPPTREAKAVLDANLKARTNKFLQEIGMGMKGPYAVALQNFLGEEEGEDDGNEG
jgi:hypothetical protein